MPTPGSEAAHARTPSQATAAMCRRKQEEQAARNEAQGSGHGESPSTQQPQQQPRTSKGTFETPEASSKLGCCGFGGGQPKDVSKREPQFLSSEGVFA